MEKKIRFRNHISIVLEQLGAVSWVLFVLLLTNVDDVVRFLEDGNSEEVNMTVLIAGVVLFGSVVLTCMYQLVLWSKTYISICGNSIVIERNTLHKKKNTIGIKNISNVNTEQNLLEMLLGTCKVKLDTNSMSTADQTDVKIVLKKADAEQLKGYIMKLMRQCKGEKGMDSCLLTFFLCLLRWGVLREQWESLRQQPAKSALEKAWLAYF